MRYLHSRRTILRVQYDMSGLPRYPNLALKWLTWNSAHDREAVPKVHGDFPPL